MAPLASKLPAELWDHVLLQLEPDELQAAALSLGRALGERVPLSAAVRWRHLRVTRDGQAWQCIHALRTRKNAADPASAVRSLTCEVWRDDPQMLVNLALQCDHLRALSLTVGPVASPEHLEDLLDPGALRRNQTGRFKQLEQLAFRFNPYCAERSYYTFLKVNGRSFCKSRHLLTHSPQGAYFDVAPSSLARMDIADLPRLRRLSFIQDLPPTHGSIKKEIPAFGLQHVQEGLSRLDVQGEQEDAGAGSDADRDDDPPAVAQIAGKFVPRKRKTGKMDFAQPIVRLPEPVELRLECLKSSSLTLSPLCRCSSKRAA